MQAFGMAPLLGSVGTWLTPIWLIGAGCLLGLVALAVLYGVVRLALPWLAVRVDSSLREGFLMPVLGLASGFAVFAIVSVLLSVAKVGYLPLDDLMRSLERLPMSRQFEETVVVHALPPSERSERQEFSLGYRPQEMRSIELESDQKLSVYLRDPDSYSPGALRLPISVEPNEVWRWPNDDQSATSNPFDGRIATVFVNNLADTDANLVIRGTTREEYPQVAMVPRTAAALLAVVIGYLLLQLALPKIMAIASATSKEAVSQPMYQVVLVIGAFALLLFVYIPYNTFGEDVKMLKMAALEWIMALAILVAAWTASISISDEIEGRTALTVLSKPLGRIQFILGKFFGVVQSVSLLYFFLGALLLVTVSGKVVYDTRESALPDAAWVDCYSEIVDILPGLILAFLETIVITSISVAIATRLSMLPNLIISFSIYALGNLAPMLVQSEKMSDPYGIVRFVGQFLAVVLPVLENFNIQAAVAAGRTVPLDYLGLALLYCVVYSTIAMLLALVLFEDRDLA